MTLMRTIGLGLVLGGSASGAALGQAPEAPNAAAAPTMAEASRVWQCRSETILTCSSGSCGTTGGGGDAALSLILRFDPPGATVCQLDACADFDIGVFADPADTRVLVHPAPGEAAAGGPFLFGMDHGSRAFSLAYVAGSNVLLFQGTCLPQAEE